MIDSQYLLMFITKNRQKTALLSPNREAEVLLKSKADVLSCEWLPHFKVKWQSRKADIHMKRTNMIIFIING